MATVPINADSSPGVVLELLYSIKVKDAMTREVMTASPTSRLRDVQTLMRDNAITGIPILDEGRLLGIVSIGDIISALDSGTMDRSADAVMSGSVITLDEEMPLSFAVTYFDRYKFGRFPVLDSSGRLSGIITASDILRRLLIALNEEIGKMEQRIAGRHAASGGPVPMMELSFGTTPLDFSRAGNASARFKKALVEKGCPPPIARKAAVASYELELNQVIHSTGGIMRMRVFDDSIEISAQDEGPGIPDVDLAMQEGYSTANEWVRSLGFGAGMGLPNVKRVADEFSISSEMGKGTFVMAVIKWDKR
ncbi:MAG: CBS domain-containing protein [Spirochaetales bacterium]